MIGDPDHRCQARRLIHPNASGAQPRTPADNNATIRSVFVIGPDKKIKLNLTYPMTTGRNFDEVLRVLDSMQLTAKTRSPRPRSGSRRGRDHRRLGENDEAAKVSAGLKSPKPYLRIVSQTK
jgi:alkyl hydroperoxide reductase subunit AhpC